MNSTQIHERLRQEVQRRIQRGTLSVSLLARQTRLSQAHLSNFLQSKRLLSFAAMDRVLEAQHLTIADLLPATHPRAAPVFSEEGNSVPIVSHASAIFEPFVRAAAAQAMLHVPAGVLESARNRTSSARRASQRFVAVRAQPADALPMEPLILADAIVLLDRHYTSFSPYRSNRPSLLAVRHGAHLTLRYVELFANRLILRPHNIAFPLESIEPDPGQHPQDLLVGRVVLIVNEP